MGEGVPIPEALTTEKGEFKVSLDYQRKLDPKVFMLEVAIGGKEKALEYQQEDGIRWLLNNDVLPTNASSGVEGSREQGNEIAWTRRQLEEAGIRLGETLPGDPLFQQAKLPEGWRKEKLATHEQTVDVKDGEGKLRFVISYKNQIHDRSATIEQIGG